MEKKAVIAFLEGSVEGGRALGERGGEGARRDREGAQPRCWRGENSSYRGDTAKKKSKKKKNNRGGGKDREGGNMKKRKRESVSQSKKQTG